MDVKSAAFFLKQRLRPGVMEAYKTCVENQGLDSSGLKELNWRKRKSLLAHAFDKSKFWRARLRKEGVFPDDVRCEADWESLPILSKEDIRANFDDIIVRIPGRPSRISTTGGSTGVPLKVVHDLGFPLEVLGWRMLSWWGISPAANAAFCWRDTSRSSFHRLTNAALWLPTRRVKLDASRMDAQSMTAFYHKLLKVNPEYLQGYTGALEFLANFIGVIDDERLQLKAVWGTSSPVTMTQRRHLEHTFRSKFYDQYGCGEVFWLAAECAAHSGLHVFSDYRHIEVVTDRGEGVKAGNVGSIVISDLENYQFPILRYQNGDRGSFAADACACGLPFPLLDPIRGRVSDLLLRSDGGAVSGDFVTTLFDEFPEAVSAFLVRQRRDLSITLEYVPGEDRDLTNLALSEVRSTLVKKLGGTASIDMKPCSRIDSDRGKTRFVVREK